MTQVLLITILLQRSKMKMKLPKKVSHPLKIHFIYIFLFLLAVLIIVLYENNIREKCSKSYFFQPKISIKFRFLKNFLLIYNGNILYHPANAKKIQKLKSIHITLEKNTPKIKFFAWPKYIHFFFLISLHCTSYLSISGGSALSEIMSSSFLIN